jgi:hypothetical protein
VATISIEGQIGELKGSVGELKGHVGGLSKRMDDMHRLLMILIGVAGGGLLTAVIGLVFQLLE